MKHKFGIIGTSCAGKTTLAHQIVGRLKSYGILADGLFSQDRKFSFPIAQIETEAAQNWMITNLISKECDLFLHSDVQILITDRTPIDLFAYYAVQYDTPLSRACWAYAKQWATTYSKLYYLEPLPYQNDTKRPPDEFRLKVDLKLLALLKEIPNAVSLERHEVLVDLMLTSGLKKPTTKTKFSETDFQAIADAIGRPLIVKVMAEKDGLSDQDMWIMGGPSLISHLPLWRTYIKGLVGQFTLFDLNVALGTETFDFDFVIYKPGHGYAS